MQLKCCGAFMRLCVCHSKDRKPSLFVFLAAPSSLNSPIVEQRTGDITQPAAFDVSVLKEPLIAIRISLNKRLRNIGWFLAFASHPCLLTSRVWSAIITLAPASRHWQFSPWRGPRTAATHWLHQSVRNCNIKNNNRFYPLRLALNISLKMLSNLCLLQQVCVSVGESVMCRIYKKIF